MFHHVLAAFIKSFLFSETDNKKHKFRQRQRLDNIVKQAPLIIYQTYMKQIFMVELYFERESANFALTTFTTVATCNHLWSRTKECEFNTRLRRFDTSIFYITARLVAHESEWISLQKLTLIFHQTQIGTTRHGFEFWRVENNEIADWLVSWRQVVTVQGHSDDVRRASFHPFQGLLLMFVNNFVFIDKSRQPRIIVIRIISCCVRIPSF